MVLANQHQSQPNTHSGLLYRLLSSSATAAVGATTSILFHLPIDHWHRSSQQERLVSNGYRPSSSPYPSSSSSRLSSAIDALRSAWHKNRTTYRFTVISNVSVLTLHDQFMSVTGSRETTDSREGSNKTLSTLHSVLAAGISGMIAHTFTYSWSLPKVVRVDYWMKQQSVYRDRPFYRSLLQVFMYRGLSLGLFDVLLSEFLPHHRHTSSLSGTDIGIRWLLACATSSFTDVTLYPLHRIQLMEIQKDSSRSLKSLYQGYGSWQSLSRIHRPAMVLTVYSLVMNHLSYAAL